MKKRNGIAYTLIWLGLHIIMVPPQLAVLAVAVLVSNSADSLLITILITCSVMAPVIVPLGYIVIMRKRAKYGNILMGISIVTFLIILDIIVSLFGTYSVGNFIDSQRKTIKMNNFERNNPARGKMKILIHEDASYKWYLDKDTGMVEEVREDYYEVDTVSDFGKDPNKPILSARTSNDTLLEIISFDSNKTRFNIVGQDRTYEVDKFIMGNMDIALYSPLRLSKEGNIISYNIDDVPDGVRVTSINFKKNGKQELSRAFKGNSVDISVAPTVDGGGIKDDRLIAPGDWEVYLQGYHPEFGREMILSNTLEY